MILIVQAILSKSVLILLTHPQPPLHLYWHGGFFLTVECPGSSCKPDAALWGQLQGQPPETPPLFLQHSLFWKRKIIFICYSATNNIYLFLHFFRNHLEYYHLKEVTYMQGITAIIWQPFSLLAQQQMMKFFPLPFKINWDGALFINVHERLLSPFSYLLNCLLEISSFVFQSGKANKISLIIFHSFLPCYLYSPLMSSAVIAVDSH